MNIIIVCTVILVVLIIISLFNNSRRCKKTKKNNEDETELQDIDTNTRDIDTRDMQDTLGPKVLKYFGGAYCPHSREGSRAYNLVKDFEVTYPNVTVEYYWTGDLSTKDEFLKADARFVPTITDGSYNKIEMSIQPGSDVTDKSQDELKEMVMANMYRKL